MTVTANAVTVNGDFTLNGTTGGGNNLNLSGPVNLTGPQPVTNAEFTRVLAKRLHRPALIPAPAFALRVALGEFADEMLASRRVIPARLNDTGFGFRHRTLDEALAAVL